MFAGPGSGPLLGAAAAWDELAADLASSASSFGSVTSDLASGSWLGPSATAMMAAASQYVGYLSAAAAQAEQAAGQARAVASAFEVAQAAAVQPAVVTANRGLMQLLATTNSLGQSAPAIADTEAAYEQMWALDVAAMSGYHVDASAAASQLTPWPRSLPNLGINIGKSGQVNLNLGGGSPGSVNFDSGNPNIGSAASGPAPSPGLRKTASGIPASGFFNSGNHNFGGPDSGTREPG